MVEYILNSISAQSVIWNTTFLTSLSERQETCDSPHKTQKSAENAHIST